MWAFAGGCGLLRSQTLVTHVLSGGETLDTEVLFVSESESSHLQTISLTSFIYRHHPVWPAVCLPTSRPVRRPTGFDLQDVRILICLPPDALAGHFRLMGHSESDLTVN